MKKMIALLLTTVFLVSTGTSVYANDVHENVTDAEKILEQMENIGFWEKDEVSVTRSATVIEYTRYDGEKTKVEISDDSGNQIFTFKSEGKVNTVVVTPDGKYYVDTVSDENLIRVNITTPYTADFKTATENGDTRITAETWKTSVTPYDNGPYTFNRNMTKNIDIELNREMGSFAMDYLLFLIAPEVPVLCYFIGPWSELNDFINLLECIQKMFPNHTGAYIQEKYYNGDSDTSGRPMEYCYQVWTRVAKDNTFSSFVETDRGVSVQISYAKQLIYA